MKKLEISVTRQGTMAIAAMFFSVVLSQVANAAQQDANSKPIFGAVPMPCASEATQLMNQQLVRMAPDQILDGMGRALNTRNEWARGNPKYERVREVVVGALAIEEQTSGPLFKFTPDKILSDVVSSWTAEEKAYFANFFSKQSGKLYLTDILEGAICEGWLKSLNSAPFPPLDGVGKVHWEELISSFKGGEDRFVIKLNKLSKEERQSFETGYKRLGRVFDSALMKVTAQQDADLRARIEKAMNAHVAQILEIANAR